MPATEIKADSDGTQPFQAAGDGVRVFLRVQPKSSRDRVDGLTARPDGAPVLKVRVTAPPEDGKANAAVIKLLSKTWGLPKSDFQIQAGAADRSKILHLAGEPQALLHRLQYWLAGLAVP